MTRGATHTEPPSPSTPTSSRPASDPDLGALRSRLRRADPPQRLRPVAAVDDQSWPIDHPALKQLRDLYADIPAEQL